MNRGEECIWFTLINSCIASSFGRFGSRYLDASYPSSAQNCLNISLFSSFRGAAFHLLESLINKAKALPLISC